MRARSFTLPSRVTLQWRDAAKLSSGYENKKPIIISLLKFGSALMMGNSTAFKQKKRTKRNRGRNTRISERVSCSPTSETA